MSFSKIVTIVGARPQFVKAAAVTPALAKEGLEEILLHTGQHYDWEMSASFFQTFHLPEPKYNLGVGSASHGAQTGQMLERIEEVLLREQPRMVVVYGDTNSTLAGALAAAKLNIPVAHVEAGLRSFDRSMPEEINRILADHVSALLFAPTKTAVRNLRSEGITQGVVLSGDVMYEVLERMAGAIEKEAEKVLPQMGLSPRRYVFVTVHRAENTDRPEKWNGILDSLRGLVREGWPVVWAVHPRCKAALEKEALAGVLTTPPLPYVSTQALTREAAVVLTDSGGLQKEAAFHGTPCLVLRDRTEWKELQEEGRVIVVGTEPTTVVPLAARLAQKATRERFAPNMDEPPSLRISRILREGLEPDGFRKRSFLGSKNGL